MIKKTGFTMVELLAVIAIMSVLAGLLLPALSEARTRARVAAAQAMIASLQTALSMYNLEYGVYPASSASAGSQYDANSFDPHFDGAPNNLVASLTNPSRGGPYMDFRGRDLIENPGAPSSRRFAVRDPWGLPYIYVARRALDGGDASLGPFHPYTDAVENNTYNIYSLGPDGMTHGNAGYAGGTWNTQALYSSENCGHWRATDDPNDPRYDDINSWDGARRGQ